MQNTNTAKKQHDKKTLSTMDIVKFAESQVTLGKNHTGETYAQLPDNQILDIESDEFRSWLAFNIREIFGIIPPGTTIADAQVALHDQCNHKGHPWKLRLRAHRGENNVIEIDIGDENGQRIQISSGQWRIIPNSEGSEIFLRSPNAQALCLPSGTPSLFKLQPHLNFENEDDFFFYLIVVTYYIYANQEFIISSFVGDPGSGKSIAATITSLLLDPSKQPLCALPKKEQDMYILAAESYVLFLDNIPPIVRQDISDTLAIFATGGALPTRKLFSNKKLVRHEACLPVCTTSVHPIACRADLADRTVQFEFKRVRDTDRQPADVLKQKLIQDLPDIMAGLYDLVADTLLVMETMDYSGKAMPRITGLGRWGWAAEQALNLPEGTFMSLFNRASRAASEGVLDTNPLLGSALKLCQALPEGEIWKGTTRELLEDLRSIDPTNSRNKGFPKCERSLGRHIGELNTSLSPYGYQIDRKKSGGIKYNLISKKAA